MIRNSPAGPILGLGIAMLTILFLFTHQDCSSAGPAKRSTPVVSIVFFYSRECDHCKAVSRLLEGIRQKYRIRLKKFNIDTPRSYELFEKLEAIHAKDRFAVPLIMLGESILVGERDIAKRLESTIRALAKSGGAPFPYLGPSSKKPRKKTKNVGKPSDSRCDCEDRRPPTLGEEWSKLRKLVDQFF